MESTADFAQEITVGAGFIPLRVNNLQILRNLGDFAGENFKNFLTQTLTQTRGFSDWLKYRRTQRIKADD
jgi:hypothetical protein